MILLGKVGIGIVGSALAGAGIICSEGMISVNVETRQPEKHHVFVVAPAMLDQPELLWVSGTLTFASGLAIVLGHNVWSDPVAAVVSLLGWMMTIKGPRYCWFRPLVGSRCSVPCTIRHIPAFTRSFRRWREHISPTPGLPGSGNRELNGRAHKGRDD